MRSSSRLFIIVLILLIHIVAGGYAAKAADLSVLFSEFDAGMNSRMPAVSRFLVAQKAQGDGHAGSASQPDLQAVKERTAGSWELRCPQGESCRVSQSIVSASNREPILVARAFKTPVPVLVITVPAGIYLAPGLALKFGDGKTRRYPFETCTSEGCHTGIKLDSGLLTDLRKSKEAKVSFFDGTQKVVTALLSLGGFSEQYDALK